MKKIFFIAALALLFVSCTDSSREFSIYGTVTNPDLEGACIYLVPMLEEVILPSRENLDSTFIKEGKFEFHGNVERISDLRLERYRRIDVQNLLVVTEPGTINVTIGLESFGGGTPQNDSLQVWKGLNLKLRQEMAVAGDKEERDALYQKFKARTLELAHNCGDGSTLSEFLLHLYPEN